jgi:hypothetical protein
VEIRSKPTCIEHVTHNRTYYKHGWRVDCLTCESRINDAVVMCESNTGEVLPNGG